MGRRRREGPAIDYVGGLKEESTAFAGLVLLLDVYREAGIGKMVERVLPQKRSPKGLRQEQMVEAFVALSSLGVLERHKPVREYNLTPQAGAAGRKRGFSSGFSITVGLVRPPPHHPVAFLAREGR